MGILGEVDLIHPLYEGKIKTEDPIEPLIRKNFSQVNPEDSISKLSEILESGNYCVVMSENKIIGIITKIDLISYLSERMKKEGQGI
jgi:predicted transcriptional regulator